MSAVKTDVNPSDVVTKALERERFCMMRAMLGLGNELAETCSPGNDTMKVDSTMTSHLARRGGVLDCGVNSHSRLHTFSEPALESSLMFVHIARRLGPKWNQKTILVIQCSVHFDTFRSTLRLICSLLARAQ